MNLERTERLRSLASQLLLFESRLCRKQRNISRLLVERETVIKKQQLLIHRLQSTLNDAGLDCPSVGVGPDETNLDSLNDSDSAVIMEDDDVYRPLNCSSGDVVTVVRSISDALESKKSQSSNRRNNGGFLRRPEVLETVYSVEEDADGDGQSQNPTSTSEPGAEMAPNSNHSFSDPNLNSDQVPASRDCKLSRGRLKEVYGSFEVLDKAPDGDTVVSNQNSPDPPSHTAYNRVMSNHRNVTKPKDVKYKRINKAKSKSLEELRGRLKNWVDKGNKINISLDQSYA